MEIAIAAFAVTLGGVLFATLLGEICLNPKAFMRASRQFWQALKDVDAYWHDQYR